MHFCLCKGYSGRDCSPSTILACGISHLSTHPRDPRLRPNPGAPKGNSSGNGPLCNLLPTKAVLKFKLRQMMELVQKSSSHFYDFCIRSAKSHQDQSVSLSFLAGKKTDTKKASDIWHGWNCQQESLAKSNQIWYENKSNFASIIQAKGNEYCIDPGELCTHKCVTTWFHCNTAVPVPSMSKSQLRMSKLWAALQFILCKVLLLCDVLVRFSWGRGELWGFIASSR